MNEESKNENSESAGEPAAGAGALPAREEPVEDLYSNQDESGLESIPTRSTQALAEPVVRTHGASDIPDSAFWTGHAVSGVLLVVALVLIAWARGPRKADALHSIWQQKRSK